MAAFPSLSRNFSTKSATIIPFNDKVKLNRRIHLPKEVEHGRKTKYFHANEAPKMINGLKSEMKKPLRISLDDALYPKWYASEFDNSAGNHQTVLQTYLEKLENETEQQDSLNSEKNISNSDDQSSEARKGLGTLEQYFTILEQDAKSGRSISGRHISDMGGDLATRDIVTDQRSEQKSFSRLNIYKRGYMYAQNSASPTVYDVKDCGNLYLISMLVAVNIAVFLFEMASPVKGSEYDLYSLPLMYGAKVNDLIMVGEWWRLVTPMFLHSGLIDIALNSWVLLSFGPQVCKGYGSFTFLLIYILGGISGNFSSFLLTSDPTVGGSGPVFAVIGAWLVYQIQNKESVENEVSKLMYEKAIMVTALSFVLGRFGPVDNWTMVGATMSGIIYSYLTCPILQQQQNGDDTSSDNLQQHKLKQDISSNNNSTLIIPNYAHPCKSLLFFTLFLFLFTSFFLFQDSPVVLYNLQELEGLL